MDQRGRTGKVWLVGAGPGDAGLLTLRGREVLERAEVVVFDRLVGSGLFSLFPDGAERVDVGKRGGCHPVPQEEIEAILVDRALAGRRVVRLKGGDSFLFGRGGEEIEALLEHDIPFEVVPGVTSALAVPACAGIPVTHRGLSSSVHVITAHTRAGELPPLDFEAMARLKGTLVFLMGVGAAGEICSRLVKAGMPGATPAAAVERGTTARQRLLAGTLESLPERIRASGIRPPAVLVVGETVTLADRLGWRDRLPLSGVRVLVTRPRERSGRLARMLRDAGAEVLEFPCICTEPLPGPLPRIGGAGWIVFTSAAGVESFFALLAEEGRDVREIGDARVAAVGPATRDALRARGLRVDYVPKVCDGAHLADGLVDRARGGDVLLLRAETGAPGLSEGLKARGVPFREHSVYRTRCAAAGLPSLDFDAAVFTSASTVRGLADCLPDGWDRGGFRAVCIGEMTARAAAEAGFSNVTTAAAATLEALIEATIRTTVKTRNEGEDL